MTPFSIFHLSHALLVQCRASWGEPEREHADVARRHVDARTDASIDSYSASYHARTILRRSSMPRPIPVHRLGP